MNLKCYNNKKKKYSQKKSKSNRISKRVTNRRSISKAQVNIKNNDSAMSSTLDSNYLFIYIKIIYIQVILMIKGTESHCTIDDEIIKRLY